MEESGTEGLEDHLAVVGEVGSAVLVALPLIESVVSLAKGFAHARDELFRRKIRRFLSDLNSVDETHRKTFAEKVDALDESDRVKASELILEVLDKSIDSDAASYVASVFVAYILGRIGRPQFERLMYALNLCHLRDIGFLLEVDILEGDDHDHAWMQRLIASGLVRKVGQRWNGESVLKVSEWGQDLRSILRPLKRYGVE